MGYGDYDFEVEDLSLMVGKTPTHIWQEQDDKLHFAFSDGSFATFLHEQDCCETVSIDDVNGDWSDLIGSELLVADVRTSEDNPKEDDGWTDESATWTFYTFRSVSGSVDVKWYGASNGYYSERVNVYIFPQQVAQKRGMTAPAKPLDE